MDDVIAVAAIPVTDYDGSAFIGASIDSSLFNPPLANAIVIGTSTPVTNGVLIPIKVGTGSVKDSENDGVAGRSHTVTVSCDVDDRDGEVWDDLLLLERSERHLLLTFRGGTQGFVNASRDSYLFHVDRDGSKTTATFKIHNILGVQIIV